MLDDPTEIKGSIEKRINMCGTQMQKAKAKELYLVNPESQENVLLTQDLSSGPMSWWRTRHGWDLKNTFSPRKFIPAIQRSLSASGHRYKVIGRWSGNLKRSMAASLQRLRRFLVTMQCDTEHLFWAWSNSSISNWKNTTFSVDDIRGATWYCKFNTPSQD